MSLRTTALVAGVIGALLLATGLIADSQRPPSDVTAVAKVDTAIVVFEPEMLAFAGESRIGVTGEGEVVALSARPADAAAWLADREATRVTGLPDWETLSATTEPLTFEAAATPAVSPSPTVSPSPSQSPSASPSPEPTPTASPSPGAEDETEDEPVNVLAESSQDHWRTDWRGENRLAFKGTDVPPGEVLVVINVAGTPFTQTDLALTREVDDGWITPLIWWGAFLLTAGVIAFVLRFIDLRPAQARGEEWMAKRQRSGEDGSDPRPGTRRARRASGDVLPEPRLDEEAIAASAAARMSGATPASAASAPVAESAPDASGFSTDEGKESR